MERLTKNNKRKLSHGEEIVICKHSENDCNDSCMKIIPCKWYKKAIEKLKRYEDLEEQGRLVKLPCKVGNTVYVIVGKNISAQKIQRATIDSEGKIEFCTKRRGFALFDIGKTVFLTKPEAEAKLKELRGGGVNEKTDS
jgi:hypothetical protein